MGYEAVSMVALAFSLPDGAAAPSTAVALAPAGVPDLTDQTTGQIQAPANGFIYGASFEAAPASGDTVVLSVTINGTIQAATTKTIANGGTNRTSVWLSTPIAVSSLAGIGIKYTTTTGGTYTVNDLSGQVFVGFAVSGTDMVPV